MAVFTDINELKRVFAIDLDDHSEDVKLNFCNEWTGNLIESLLDRPIFLKSRTEFPQPTNTQKLLLKARPVYTTPTPQVWVDENAMFGEASGAFASATQLTYGTDFGLWIDNSDGLSHSGILLRVNNLWNKRCVRRSGYLSAGVAEGYGTIKVIYSGGYTLDSLPGDFRVAADLLIARLRFLFPIGFEMGGDSYEDKAVSFVQERKGWLMSIIKPILWHYRNWNFG